MEPSELDSVDLLLQFNEESGELIQAVAKLVRKERGTNPTPVTSRECVQALVEELADVSLVLDVLAEHWGVDPDAVDLVKYLKRARWQERLSR